VEFESGPNPQGSRVGLGAIDSSTSVRGGGERMRRQTALGRYGEEVAAGYLQAIGMAVVDRNWRCDVGEIDIVAREGAVLVLCEVKTRSTEAFGTPMEAITARKVRRLRQLAYRWLCDHDIHAPSIRIDAIGVTQGRMGAPVIEHVRGVD
jgi:putative endonuclease